MNTLYSLPIQLVTYGAIIFIKLLPHNWPHNEMTLHCFLSFPVLYNIPIMAIQAILLLTGTIYGSFFISDWNFKKGTQWSFLIVHTHYKMSDLSNIWRKRRELSQFKLQCYSVWCQPCPLKASISYLPSSESKEAVKPRLLKHIEAFQPVITAGSPTDTRHQLSYCRDGVKHQPESWVT